MIKIITILGARPQIIKAAAINRIMKKDYSESIREIFVHTGQHYDTFMSQVFIDQLGLPEMHYNLGIGSGTHATQTARMMQALEDVFNIENPDGIIIYGDTNSTLAGAVTAAKMKIPIIHIEAGMRSFNKSMPEEINRIVSDHHSTLLFTPTKQGLHNLIKEGFSSENAPPYNPDHPGIFHCGDIMFDNIKFYSKKSGEISTIIKDLKLTNVDFILTTTHREINTDHIHNLNEIISALLQISRNEKIKIIFPVHPRTRKVIRSSKELEKDIKNNKNLVLIEPISFFDMIELEKNAKIIMTDSGGVQKEAFFNQKPVVVLREETEWVEIIENKTGILTGANKDKILSAYLALVNRNDLTYPAIYGDGKSAEFICEKIQHNFSS